MKSKLYRVKLTGLTPLILHNQDLEHSARVDAFRHNPMNRKTGPKGDDRYPAWAWIGSVYRLCPEVGIPSDNLMSMIITAGTRIDMPKGRGNMAKTLCSAVQVQELSWPIIGPKGIVKVSDIDGLMDELEFGIHQQVMNEKGIRLFCKPAKIGAGKHIRVRPVFDSWAVEGTVLVLDPAAVTGDILELVFSQAGTFCGLCDWRPSSPKRPGSFGTFSSEVTPVGK